jgi:hypothetical protein
LAFGFAGEDTLISLPDWLRVVCWRRELRVMRVLVVCALAATLAGCATSRQTPIDHAPRVHSTLTGLHHTPRKVVARTKRSSRHQERDIGNTRTAINVEPHSSALDDKSAAAKVREIIAAKLGHPASIKFPDIARGKGVHSFCGTAEVTGASEGARELPFVYLARKNKLYVIDGSDDRRASTVIHKMCD